MNALKGLQNWYTSQCDGDWEHSFGVRVETLDNPGWLLEVDLRETSLLDRTFRSIQRGDPNFDVDWITCKVEQEKFIAAGGAHSLEEMIATFLTWAAA